MKTHQQIQAEIAASSQLPKFDRYPAVMECWNENEQLWRDDNGCSYAHWVANRRYEYHLLYFDGQLAIAERNGITILSHLTERFTRVMADTEPVKLTTNYAAISLAELAAIKPQS
jgi:hypothetical protein